MILSSPKSLFIVEPSSLSSSPSRTTFGNLFPSLPRFSSWQRSSDSPETPSPLDNKWGFTCPSMYRRRRNSSSSDDSPRQLPSTIRTTPSGEPTLPPAEGSPDWKYATQGLHLLSTSIAEAQTSSPLSRQLYIHSMTYLLQALPQDLSPPESVSLQSALPLSLSPPITTSLILSPSTQSTTTPPPPPPPTPSFLHRILASTIIQLFLVIRLFLPYIRVLLQAACRYEREYRVTERMLKGGVEVVHGLLGMVNGVFGGGRGDLLGKILGWWFKGICGGLQEGVGVGMARIGWGE